jgi:metal-responsive CopG/Arc/MetJ family transcriptional regulator
MRTQIYLPREQHRELKRRAAERGTSMAQLIREAIREAIPGDQGRQLEDSPRNGIAEPPTAAYGEGDAPAAVAVQLGTEDLRRLDEAARARGQGRGEWVAEVVRRELSRATVDRRPYRGDAAWSLPELASAFAGLGDTDAAERHDELLYGPASDPTA